MDNKMIYGLPYALITTVACWLGRTLLPLRKAELDIVADKIKKCGAKKVLDYGCNTGHFTNRLVSELRIEAVGCDINEYAIRIARKYYPNVAFHPIDQRFIENNQNTFDVIVLSHVLEHIHNRDEVLGIIRSLLKAGGAVFIIVPQERIRGDATIPQLLWNLLTLNFVNPHVVKLKAADIARLCDKSGLRIEDSIYTNYFFPRLSKEPRFNSWSLVTTAVAK